ncbi:Gfo/Idh/MocA family oxidoreductase [Candidatus Woesearchaeota archaeon]|nr:Gfo/Idh/MocA family oxidoreductase [Candidatus Woesearchaeota archaeon]
MVNIAVIGTGTWGKNHVRVLSELGEVNLVKICDMNEKSLLPLQKTFHVSATTDYKEILNDKTIQTVNICTPASMHYSVVKEMLLAGKDVLVEKPLTLDIAQSEELAKIAKDNNRILMVGHIFRFNAGVNKLKDEIKKGTFGKIRFMYGARMGLMTPRVDCGVIADFALHDIDTFCYLLDEMPTEITCVGQSYKDSGNQSAQQQSQQSFEDVGFITLRFNSNIIANVGVSWLTPKKVRELWVVGEKKSAYLDYLTQELTIFDKGIVPQYNSFGEFSLITKQDGDDIKPFVPVREPLKDELLHFIDCINTRKQPIVNGEIGTQMVKIINKAYQALKEKKTISIN